MDINFINKDHLIIAPTTTANGALKCDNCSAWYQNDVRLQKLGSTSLDTETHLWNALAFIYGATWKSIKNYNSKKGSDFLKSPDDLRFCNNCTSLLNDNYNAHLKFEQSSDSSSIVQLLKEFRDYPISSSEKQTDVQFLSNDLVEAGERDIKMDLLEDYVLEDPAEGPFETDDPVEKKYEPPSTPTEYFSDGNTSEQSRSTESPTLRRLRSRQLVIKTEKMTPQEILQFTNKTIAKKKRDHPKKRKRATTVKYLGKDPSATAIVKLKEESPVEKKIITAAQIMKPRRKKAATKKKTATNPGSLSFEEKVKLIMEKYKGNTKCMNVKLQGSVICTVCGKCFKTFDYLKRRHWPTHQEDSAMIRVCDVCGKSVHKLYIKQYKVRAHATEEEQNQYKTKCNLCDEIVFSFAMSAHLGMRHSKRQEKCNQCGKVCINIQSLKAHLRSHSNASEKCDLCDKVFKSLLHLKGHKINVHGNRERKYCCDICPHKVCTKAELDNHKLTHTDIREYICDECGKTFKYKSHFHQHRKCHKEIAEKGEGSFICDLCDGRAFKHSLSLKKHIDRIHRNKIYQCSVCSKRLSSALNLRVHENMHKEKPGFVPRVRTKLPEYILKGQNSSDKLTSSSQIQPISMTESTDNN